MQIFVKTPTGRIITLNMEPYDTIKSLRAKIQERDGSYYEHVLFAGTRLEDNKTLSDCKIQKESTLSLAGANKLV